MMLTLEQEKALVAAGLECPGYGQWPDLETCLVWLAAKRPGIALIHLEWKDDKGQSIFTCGTPVGPMPTIGATPSEVVHSAIIAIVEGVKNGA